MGLFDKLKRQKKEEKQEKAPASAADEKKKEAKEEKKSASDKKTEEKPAEAKPLGDNHRILLRPMLTEKSFTMQQQNMYSFYVDPKANKHQVKSAIKEVYGIQPISVNMSMKRGIAKKRWGRKVGMTKTTKKAIVKMPEGTVLNLTD